MDLSQDTLLAILAAVLIADVLVVAFALAWTNYQKRKLRDAAPPAMAMPVARPVTGSTPLTGRAYTGADTSPTLADPTADPLTGLLVASSWARIIVDEEARIRRYHRPATIVIIEVEGLDRLVSRLGPASVDRIVPAVADTLRRGAREADFVARLATGRFAVLMPETDEVLAINYIERVRKACDLWLESGAVSLRLAVGWASSTGDGSLVDAEALATDRMYAELRRASRANTPDAAGGAGDARRWHGARVRRVVHRPQTAAIGRSRAAPGLSARSRQVPLSVSQRIRAKRMRTSSNPLARWRLVTGGQRIRHERSPQPLIQPRRRRFGLDSSPASHHGPGSVSAVASE